MKQDKQKTDFQRRFDTFQNEMRRLYFSLYRGCEDGYDRFCGMLRDFYRKRPEEFKQRDLEKEAEPDWYYTNDMVGMQIYADAFADDLKGVTAHLDYLKETGINVLHLMPLMECSSQKSDNGYSVNDFRKVRKDLGTMDDLRELVWAARQSGIMVCLDLILNHTGEDHDWARRAKKGDLEYQKRYYFFDDWMTPNEYEKTKPQVLPKSAPGNFTWDINTHKVVMTTFHSNQWDLNYHNPAVFHEMCGNLLFLCNAGVEIVRLGAVSYIWKEIGTDCIDLPEVHTILRLFRMAVDIVCPGVLLAAEAPPDFDAEVSYYGSLERPECHFLCNNSVTTSIWNGVASGDVRLLKHQLEKVFSLSREDLFINYLRNHDDVSWDLDFDFLRSLGMAETAHRLFLNAYFCGKTTGSDARGELHQNDQSSVYAGVSGTTASFCGIEAADYEWNEEKMKIGIRRDVMLHALLMCCNGLPMIYGGDEIGQLNDYTYRNDLEKKLDSNFLHRGKLNWEHANMRYDMWTRQGRLYTELVKLFSLRRKCNVFSSKADRWIVETYNDSVLGLGRYYNGKKFIALFNFSCEEEIAWINENEDYRDLITGEAVSAKGIRMAPAGFRWLLHTR